MVPTTELVFQRFLNLDLLFSFLQVDKDLDNVVEKEFNQLLEATAKMCRDNSRKEKWKDISLGGALELVIK